MSSHIEKHFLKIPPSGEFAKVSAHEWADWHWQIKGRDSEKGTPYYQNTVGNLDTQLVSACKLLNKEKIHLLELDDSEFFKKIDEDNKSKPVINFSLSKLTQLPQRITTDLARGLESRNQTIIHLFINHPTECSMELFKACEVLANAGIILNNHMTFLKGLNDSPEVVKDLNLKLIMMRVRPYSIYLKEYLAQEHAVLNVSKDQGIAVLESLRGWTSGLAVPHFLIESKEGVYQAKLPNYIKKNDGEHFVFRNYKNMDFDYINK